MAHQNRHGRVFDALPAVSSLMYSTSVYFLQTNLPLNTLFPFKYYTFNRRNRNIQKRNKLPDSSLFIFRIFVFPVFGPTVTPTPQTVVVNDSREVVASLVQRSFFWRHVTQLCVRGKNRLRQCVLRTLLPPSAASLVEKR